ncbi:MAG: hypothetical protein ACP5SG_07810 [Dissulfurimicrobium sp.]|uniref:hypothetical protein n=1 Tax=Dissulfurimicrobium TaxID=1769732 RepID=UPI001EDA9F3A|nr:hypothetical protein [Dissulfurimicrobium hydrothermale]UKL13461.1 hypothetical protein LGS26_08270 [Dissulfurimicrobium hydrothermale]
MIEIKIDGSQLKQLNRTIDRVAYMTPVMRKIAGAMHEAVEENEPYKIKPPLHLVLKIFWIKLI